MTYLGYVLAVLIGISLGLLGGGGSILTVPVLIYVMQYPMKEAVPMSLLVVGLTSAFGVASHHRKGNVRWDAALAFGPTAVLGAFMGGRLAVLVSGRLQLVIFAVLMLAAATSMLIGPGLWGGTDSAEPTGRRPMPVTALLGGAVGLLTGLVGVGGGFMYVPALVLLGGVAMKQAVGTSLALIVMSSAAGFVGHMGQVSIDWAVAGLFCGLAIVGVVIGSALVKRFSPTGLRRGFAILVLAMGLLVLLKPR